MPTPLETAISDRDAALVDRDAARNERDAAVAAKGKAVAKLEGQVGTAIAERDAARNQRDASATTAGKATAQFKGQADLAVQYKAEGNALKVDIQKKIKAAEEIGKNGTKLVNEAKVAQVKAQGDAKAARIDRDKAKAAQAVETKKAADLQVSVEAYAKAIDNQEAALTSQQETIRAMQGRSVSDTKTIRELESTVAGQTQELLRLRPARPITP